MNHDIRKAVEVINQRIANLERIKSLLLDEFGADSVLGAPKRKTEREVRQLGIGASANGHGEPTRREQLVKFLNENGPSNRATIIEKSGIPEGTISNLLTKDGFVRRSGKWHVSAPSSATQETTQ
jgi:hypothetical protein